jgi:hypothetical protein
MTIPRVLDRQAEIYTNKNGTRMIHVVLSVEYDFVALDGSKFTAGPIYSEGNDSADKATNKALSVAHKYALIQCFAIATEDMDDPDRETVPFPPPEVAKPVALKPSGAPSFIKPAATRFVMTIGKEWLGKKFADIPEDKLVDIHSWCAVQENPSAEVKRVKTDIDDWFKGKV